MNHERCCKDRAFCPHEALMVTLIGLPDAANEPASAVSRRCGARRTACAGVGSVVRSFDGRRTERAEST